MINLEEIRKVRQTGQYLLRQLGTNERVVLSFYQGIRLKKQGWYLWELFDVIHARTQYLNNIIPCEESQRAIELAAGRSHDLRQPTPGRFLTTIDKGHIYAITDGNGNIISDIIKFIKRSGKAITYEQEWSGIQTQELCRAMIDFCDFWKEHETANICRQILWEYEARAYRRKRQQLNRESPSHTPIVFPYQWENIETWMIGEDGHIPFLESEVLYYANFGVCDAEPIPGVDPFKLDTDPVYQKAAANLKEMGKP